MTAVLAGRQAEPRHVPETRDSVPAEVVQLLASADEDGRMAAWHAFVERYSRLLLSVAFDFSPGYDGAMDRYAFVLDELQRDGYRRLRRFTADGRGRFSTWLTVVARRLCLDHHRGHYGRIRRNGGRTGPAIAERLVRRRLLELSSAGDGLDRIGDAAGMDPGEELGEAERWTSLWRAVGELDPHDQLLLTLRFERDLTAGEIAVLLRMPTPFHVYRRLRRLFRALRDRLHEEGVEA